LPLTRSSQIELLDHAAESASSDDLAGNLRDIRLANRLFGGTRAVLTGLPMLFEESRERGSSSVTLLDLATGSADIPLAIASMAERRGWNLHITATDSQAAVVESARSAERPGQIAVEQADARALPYADDSFDIVLLSLALHHFEPCDALTVLREMRRVGRRALLVNDLERSRMGLIGAWLFSHALTTNRMTRHDAPLSVRRAYTRPEAYELARRAGWQAATVRRALPFRLVLTGRP
jgi:ubiquinone/menaquinone biosynthesis C-methylase UbiE